MCLPRLWVFACPMQIAENPAGHTSDKVGYCRVNCIAKTCAGLCSLRVNKAEVTTVLFWYARLPSCFCFFLPTRRLWLRVFYSQWERTLILSKVAFSRLPASSITERGNPCVLCTYVRKEPAVFTLTSLIPYAKGINECLVHVPCGIQNVGLMDRADFHFLNATKTLWSSLKCDFIYWSLFCRWEIWSISLLCKYTVFAALAYGPARKWMASSCQFLVPTHISNNAVVCWSSRLTYANDPELEEMDVHKLYHLLKPDTGQSEFQKYIED